jgi:hypothetical protein
MHFHPGQVNFYIVILAELMLHAKRLCSECVDSGLVASLFSVEVELSPSNISICVCQYQPN